MQYLLDFSIYKTKDTKNYESNPINYPPKNSLGNRRALKKYLPR